MVHFKENDFMLIQSILKTLSEQDNKVYRTAIINSSFLSYSLIF